MRKAIAGLCVLLAVTVCVAQKDRTKSDSKAKPNLSGTWVLDASRSTTGFGKDKITDYVLTIAHHEPEIKMSKKYTQGSREIVDEVVYYTDGRPEYSSLTGRVDSEPVTRWRGRKLVRRSAPGPTVTAARSSNLPFNVVTVEEWELSRDGETLTRTISTNGGIAFSFRSKYVFIRRS